MSDEYTTDGMIVTAESGGHMGIFSTVSLLNDKIKELERMKKELVKAYDVILNETQSDYCDWEGKEPGPNEKFKEMFPLMIKLKDKEA